jgi:hypothetical protein
MDPLIFYKIQISINYQEILLKYVVLSIALARTGTIFPVGREEIRIKKSRKRMGITSLMY